MAQSNPSQVLEKGLYQVVQKDLCQVQQKDLYHVHEKIVNRTSEVLNGHLKRKISLLWKITVRLRVVKARCCGCVFHLYEGTAVLRIAH
jgi:hypothetical protein